MAVDRGSELLPAVGEDQRRLQSDTHTQIYLPLRSFSGSRDTAHAAMLAALGPGGDNTNIRGMNGPNYNQC